MDVAFATTTAAMGRVPEARALVGGVQAAALAQACVAMAVAVDVDTVDVHTAFLTFSKNKRKPRVLQL